MKQEEQELPSTAHGCTWTTLHSLMLGKEGYGRKETKKETLRPAVGWEDLETIVRPESKSHLVSPPSVLSVLVSSALLQQLPAQAIYAIKMGLFWITVLEIQPKSSGLFHFILLWEQPIMFGIQFTVSDMNNQGITALRGSAEAHLRRIIPIWH